MDPVASANALAALFGAETPEARFGALVLGNLAANIEWIARALGKKE